MNTDRYERLRELFHAACELDPAERTAFLDEQCGQGTALRAEVESLLEYEHEEDDAFAESRLGVGAHLVSSASPVLGSGEGPAAPQTPDFIGQYRIVRLIGQGGMGWVYEAKQKSPHRMVALKVIRPGLVTQTLLKRFAYEAQVLGRLQHPGIASIYEAGSADTQYGPQPYFAMELVKGRALLDYANARSLGTRQRLALLAHVCDAVHHAHQKGVIHRDLKPANILVTEDGDAGRPEGQPKVLDFGIARGTDGDVQTMTLLTDVGQLMGTVPYMSPEQVAGVSREIDFRSDVYALGVIAFELLTGTLPYDLRGRPIPEMARVIREADPLTLSSVTPSLRGDIDTIVTKALEKDRTRRYQSAAELAADMRRYLDDEPIIARPASATYQLRKFAKRNKALVFGVSAFVVALIIGLIGTTWFALGAAEQRRQAEEARQIARQEARRARIEAQTSKRVSDFLVGLFKVSDPSEARGDTITARQVLDRGAARIADKLKNQPEVQARLMSLIGEIYRNLGILDPATPMLENALATQRRLYGDEHLETAATRRLLAHQLLDHGEFVKAEAMFREVLATRETLLGENHLAVAESASDLAEVFLRTEELDEAERLLRRSLAIRKRDSDAPLHEVANSTHSLAGIALARGDDSEAEALYHQALQINRRVLGPDHPSVAFGLSALGLTLRNQGKYAQAEKNLHESLALGEKLWGENSSNLAPIINNLALTLQNLGRYEQAERLFRRLLELDRRDFGREHPYVAKDLSNLGTVLHDMGKLEAAEAMYSEALSIQRKLLGEEHSSTLVTMNNLASVYQALGRCGEAEVLYVKSLTARSRVLGDEHPLTLTSKGNLAAFYIDLKRYGQSQALLEEALEVANRTLGEDDPRTIILIKNLGKLCEEQQHYADAEALYLKTLALRRRVLGADHPSTIRTIADVAALYTKQDRQADAEELLLEAYQAVSDVNDPERKRPLIEALIELYQTSGQTEQLAIWRARLPIPSPEPPEGLPSAAGGH